MANRIPSSLNWLIDKRARIAGEIEKTRRSLHKAQELIKGLEGLETKLKAIDTTLELHHIKIDISLVENIESRHLKLNIPHGELTKSILICLRIYGETTPVSKSRIVDFVIARHFDNNANETTYAQIADSVKYRLRGLYKEGKVTRHHSEISNDLGSWSLASDDWLSGTR